MISFGESRLVISNKQALHKIIICYLLWVNREQDTGQTQITNKPITDT